MPSDDTHEAPTRPTPSQEARAKFREALERKASATTRHNEGQRNRGSVTGSETSGPTQRRFRRKSGG
ncbi:DUF5302 domain-containing protein [Xylanimonas ulmi]|uniref:DUF5302 domain-containing protein n=1 Tax=Xylanimonas ulmi TaxID=228973 RepID=A0A4Q7LXN2_9MICO|nr:DUF5302 domain-containing protein [Xylanibacterium ulmi]RZS59785.1 hypothetical protein EV386_0021 [Xylanibacterium ulmi]